MKDKITPESVWKEYDRGKSYNNGIDLYNKVEKNEDFYIGDQWKGINAPDLEHPTLNFLRRVVSYFISQIVTDDVAVQFAPSVSSEEAELACRVFKTEFDRVLEVTKAKTKSRDMLRNSAVDGDGCFYFYFDADKGKYGDPEIEVVDNTKTLFGNPFVKDAQNQPYILVVQRKPISAVKAEAEANGVSKDNIESIVSDSADYYNETDTESSDNLCTVIVRFWKEPSGDGKSTIHFMKCTEHAVIKEDTDTGYRLYPVAWMPWETVKSSYHGQSPLTGLIPNQIFVNKLWAMAMEYCKRMAFPKLIVDKTKIAKWDNAVGQTIDVVGDPNNAVASSFKPADMSQQVLALVDKTISYTRDFMGASDAALGNIRPENTSAIIAVQKASSAPLELQRMSFYQFWEDCANIILEMMRVDFGIRTVSVDTVDENGIEGRETVEFNFEAPDYDGMALNVDVGASSYWSELMQIQTADSLLMNGVLTDAVTYLETIPDHYIRNKNKIIEKLREQQALQAQMAQQVVAQNPREITADDGQQMYQTKQNTVENMMGGA